MDFDDAVAYMRGRIRLGVKLGNERFLELLRRLGDPQRSLKVIHVAGTKGKGSTVALAANVLRTAGYSVGAYFSPFVYDVRERVQVNGEMIPREDFARLVTQIQPHIEDLERTEHGATTEFELKTAVGFCYFAERGVDFAVVEVGLGGRLDATNVIESPLVTVITNIGLDHTELLGPTLRHIAGEKAGIVKPGIACVTGVEPGSDSDEEIAAVCGKRGSRLLYVTNAETSESEAATYRSLFDGTVSLRTTRRSLYGLTLRLRGQFQHANAAVAAQAIDSIPEAALTPIRDDVFRLGLETAYLPARLEKIGDRPNVFVDVAHNDLSARALAKSLRDDYRADLQRLVLVVGLSRMHDPHEFLGPLMELRPDAVIATQPSFRPRPAAEVAAAARELGARDVRLTETVLDAAREALALAGPNDMILVTGSLYTVGDIPRSLWADLLKERKH